MIFIPKLIGGLGNQLFILAATIDVAERTNGQVFFNQVPGNCHSDDNLTLIDLFPRISLNTTLIPDGEFSGLLFDYCDIVSNLPVDKSVLFISGYNQNPRYVPKNFETFIETIPDPMPQLNCANIAFIHIRRGDYVNFDLYYIDTDKYLKSAVDDISRDNKTITFIIFSDDQEWANTNVPLILKDHVNENNFVMPPNLTPTQTLRVMAKCAAGAITANSSFSWWGAYCNRDRPIYMPWPWSGYDHSRDLGLYFSGVNVVDTTSGNIDRKR